MGHSYLEILISWTPIILLIGAYLILVWRVRKAQKSPSGKSYSELMHEYLEQQQRHFELTNQLLAHYERRFQRLEAELEHCSRQSQS